MFKSISENRIRKNINFGKRFPKTICEGKIGISKGLKETWGRRETIISIVIVTTTKDPNIITSKYNITSKHNIHP
jgi:hypothetical protein